MTHNIYKPLLLKAVTNPFSALTFAAGIFTLTIGIMLWNIKSSFFPAVEDDLAIATIEYPSGTPIDITSRGYNKLEEALKY